MATFLPSVQGLCFLISPHCAHSFHASPNLSEALSYRSLDSGTFAMPQRLSTIFLELPKELQIRIIGGLDGRSILACKKADRVLAQLIDETVELQYKLELALAGMIDGPPSNVCVSDRLDALRAYRASWKSGLGEHPARGISHNGACIRRINATSFVYSDRQAGTFTLHVPAAPFFGVPGRVETYAGWERVSSNPDMKNYNVSPSDDLLVYSCHGSNPLGDGYYASCTFVSLANGFTPHPLAPRPTFTACPRVVAGLQGGHMTMQLLGDLLAWTLFPRGYGQYYLQRESDDSSIEMLVVNWKTGVIAWHMHGTTAQRIKLLTNTYLVVVDREQFCLDLHSFDPSTSVDSALSTQEDRLCRLHLPARSNQCSATEVTAYLEHPPSLSRDTRPLFQYDPACTVLLLKIVLSFGTAPTQPNSSRKLFLLFIPSTTILQFCDGVPAKQSSGDSSRGRDCVPMEQEAVNATQACRKGDTDVRWEDWGTRGTKMIPIRNAKYRPAEYHTLGMRIAGSHGWEWEADSGSQKRCLVQMFEVPPIVEEDVLSLSSAGDPDELKHPEAEWIEDPDVWKDSICTTHPLRSAVRYELNDFDTRHICGPHLSVDGLLMTG
ncbi:hypothetical protein OH77DRAFT_1430272 [Trametes cingulata]|nr:hypothetical protein OH77DRAFT_1430272 [Trametes cingulata]